MRKLTLISIAVLAFAAFAVPTSVASGAASKAPLIVAMRTRVATGSTLAYGRITPLRDVTPRVGPMTLLNLDEAALIVKGPGGTRSSTSARS